MSFINRSTRLFSTSSIRLSNVGRKPIKLYEGVSYAVESIPHEFTKSFTKKNKTFTLNKQVVINGPLGKLRTPIPEFVGLRENKDDKTLHVIVNTPNNKVQRSLWGTYRSLIYNNVIGTSEGHLAIVKFVGTGYRGLLEKDEHGNDVVSLKLGFPYTPKLKIPKGIKVSSPNPTRLIIEGADKQQVKLFAASIRAYKKPEPYKGKGIFVDNETITLKQKKTKTNSAYSTVMFTSSCLKPVSAKVSFRSFSTSIPVYIGPKITSIHAITSIKTAPSVKQHTAEESNKRKLLLERPGLFAVKKGMITWYSSKGEHIPATVLEVDSCEVVGYKRVDEYGFNSVIIGAIDKLKNHKHENQLKIFEEAGVSPKHKLGEFRVRDEKNFIPVGTELTADYFSVGQLVDVKGITKGKGFAGVMKRWGFAGGRATHGTSKAHRTPGAMGGNTNPGRVFPGKKMPGRMGTNNQTTFNLEVLFTDAEAGVLIVKGSVPGPIMSIVRVSDAIKVYGDSINNINRQCGQH
ncbi:MRPL9 54S ribosomal protein L9 [Candida maltosa Xu316]